ncbi:unnamed protein product [Lampetra planeri]
MARRDAVDPAPRGLSLRICRRETRSAQGSPRANTRLKTRGPHHHQGSPGGSEKDDDPFTPSEAAAAKSERGVVWCRRRGHSQSRPLSGHARE